MSWNRYEELTHEEIKRRALLTAAYGRWGDEAMADAANLGAGMRAGDIWTEERIAKAEAWLSDRANARMVKADAPAEAPAAPEAEDPLDGVRDALDALIEFTGEDAINAGMALPGGHGCREPDISGMQKRIDDVLDEVRKLMGLPEAPVAAADDEIQLPDWLMVEHKAGSRVSITP